MLRSGYGPSYTNTEVLVLLWSRLLVNFFGGANAGRGIVNKIWRLRADFMLSLRLGLRTALFL